MSYEPDELDSDPFKEDPVEEDNLITDKMVKKATYLIHKLAEMRKEDYKEVQKKCKKLFNYSNLSKVSLEDGHTIIDKLIQLTGGEEKQEKEQEVRITDDETKHLPTKPNERLKNNEKETLKEDDAATRDMREAIRAAVGITMKEVVEKDVPVQGLGGFVWEIAKVLFDEKRVQSG
jgi:hypothetical protein